jgi:3-oxoacyl-[acyl-carrier-protein] synthase I
MMQDRRRVAVTGFGLICSIGNNAKEALHALLHNVSGIVTVPEWVELRFKSCVGGTIKGINADETREAIGLKSRYMDDSALYCALASMEAVEMSKIPPEDLSTAKVSCIIGSGVANSNPLIRAGNRVSRKENVITPYDVTRCMSSSCSANIAHLFKIRGRSYSMSSACATSLHNIGHGYELIRHGVSDMVIAGGADEVSAAITALFDGMRTALANGFNHMPEKASRPYDRKRNGFVISGGAGIVILEELQHALDRGAPIFAEVTGYGCSTDGHDIIAPPPGGEGAYRCMKEALEDAQLVPEQIDYLNSHGTGTPAGDVAEANAIRGLFGHHGVPVSSTKALTGHGLGASGAMELIFCILMMNHQFISASVNIEELDPACVALNIITRNEGRELKRIMTNSFGFGGTNACLVLAKYPDAER